MAFIFRPLHPFLRWTLPEDMDIKGPNNNFSSLPRGIRVQDILNSNPESPYHDRPLMCTEHQCSQCMEGHSPPLSGAQRYTEMDHFFTSILSHRLQSSLLLLCPWHHGRRGRSEPEGADIGQGGNEDGRSGGISN
jgi:hypothetical protein